MADEGATAGTGGSDASIGTKTWSNPGNVTASDDTLAICGSGTGVTQYLTGTNFPSSIGAGSSVDGWSFTTEGRRSAVQTLSCVCSSIRSIMNGTIQGNDNFDSVDLNPTTDTSQTRGGSADKWGLLPTLTEFKASDFGMAISWTCTGVAGVCSIDCFTMTRYYTAAAGDASQEWENSTMLSANYPRQRRVPTAI